MTESTKVTTPEFRVSYAHVFEPREGDDGTLRYGLSMIFDKAVYKKRKKDFDTAIKNAIAKKWGAKPPKNLTMPFRDGDTDRDEPAYEDSMFCNANSQNRPAIVKKISGVLHALDEPEEFYSGCYAIATVNFFAYDKNGNRGVGVGLNNLLKVRDGERLDGRTSAEDDFGDIDVETEEEEGDPLLG